MDDNATYDSAPVGWLEVLEESEAELAAGLTVPGELVRQILRDSPARLEARRDLAPQRKVSKRRCAKASRLDEESDPDPISDTEPL